jgi:hypothetical protein
MMPAGLVSEREGAVSSRPFFKQLSLSRVSNASPIRVFRAGTPVLIRPRLPQGRILHGGDTRDFPSAASNRGAWYENLSQTGKTFLKDA